MTPHAAPAADRVPLFAYGTLMHGHGNHALVESAVESVEPAVLPGAAMYDAGPYPYVLLGAAASVRGELVHLRADIHRTALAALDELEGYIGPKDPANDYERLMCTVLTDDGMNVRALVYVASAAVEPRVRQMPLVPRGDWDAHMAAQP
ncbi:gamma-glutamylcyclotransferase family protein [Wenjunlia tyrosinilytica]|uniref:Gamma-glutamylcyclotransferase n=1 Tax=Wenjunlia tyrosinilytica TaxID=1544741 RepID=A0A917ZVC5_9ACTN|nr:gamma-glutamylcyclotransferase family protein [Wenjunlia tyrosinilytica]GGO93950.1 gamma-glutamylcyclotransferase [Wenjunlia tyrosinilytica]